MNTEIITWVALSEAVNTPVAFLVSLLIRTVRNDGYGHVPAPQRRYDWGSPTLPSSPYAIQR
jgi:hypothetical protein